MNRMIGRLVVSSVAAGLLLVAASARAQSISFTAYFSLGDSLAAGFSSGSLVETNQLRSVPALIAQPGQLRTSLLGMSFLNRLESWEVRGEKLIMRGYP